MELTVIKATIRSILFASVLHVLPFTIVALSFLFRDYYMDLLNKGCANKDMS